ncbi:ParM/StbA family protein [Symbiobacterium terraclitae]|uniref:ParM/StbA family protein n=1 Tax=Symbiobacterium terraclitae TaxID=557451 RepID=UPI0035B55240
MILPLGVDLGNADLKLSGPRRDALISMPHALARVPSTDARDPSLVPPAADPWDYLHAEVLSPALPRPVEVYAGMLAAREYPHLTEEAREGEAKAGSDRHLILALVSMATALHQANPSQSHYTVALAVALPLAEAAHKEAREQLAQRLRADHLVAFRSTPGLVGREITLRLAHVDVVPEGAAAYFSLIQRDPTLVNQHVLLVDVGARSLDWAVFGPQGRFALGLSGGTADGGLIVAADRILAGARSAFGPHVARHRQDVLTALRDARLQGTPARLWGNGRPYEIPDLVDAELTRLARDVARLVSDVVQRMGRVDHLALVGGGGALLAPYLARVSDLPWLLVDNAPWANAYGLYHRAQAQLQQQVAATAAAR